ncbi:MAG: hypothetical protein ACRDNE_15505, partial [Gaiellaceae bacterium]
MATIVTEKRSLKGSAIRSRRPAGEIPEIVAEYSGSATRERSRMVEEARLEESESYSGLAPATDGWFVVSVQDAAWIENDAFGAACIFEGDDAPFPHIG